MALAPSAGRAVGALLTVILRGSRMEPREDGSVCRARAYADSLRRSVGEVGCRGLERADAAVALLGLRRQAAPGVRGFPG